MYRNGVGAGDKIGTGNGEFVQDGDCDGDGDRDGDGVREFVRERVISLDTGSDGGEHGVTS